MENGISKPFLIFKGAKVDALYSEQVLKEYRDNPLIEALPPIFSKEQVVRKLINIPDYSPEERKLEEHYRYHCIQKLFSYFEPLQKHIELEQRFSRIIRQGYISRNPLGTEYAARLQDGYKLIKNGSDNFFSLSTYKTTASGFTIIGISGIGKSKTIERILFLYPQVIKHSKYKGQCINLYQITWLKLDCPFDGSLKGLCINFFQAVDELLGTDYFRKYGAGRNSVDTMIPRMAQIANLHCIGTLIIDEIQHLNLAKSGGSDKMLNFFVTVVNTIGIPVVLVGTTKALPILQGEFRQARRGSGQGDLMWDRMKNDSYWKLLMQGMWSLQWTKKETALTQEIADTIYDRSQGIIDIAIKLYAMTQIRAITSGKEIITPKLINTVANENFKLIEPMIDALRSGDKNKISQYGDITPIDFQEFYEKNVTKIPSDLREAIDDNYEFIKEYAILKLVELGIDSALAKDCVIKIMNESGNLDKTYIVKEAMKVAFENENKIPEKPKTISKKVKTGLNSSDLRFIVDEGRKKLRSSHDALIEAGLIKDPAKEFFDEEHESVNHISQSIS